MRALVRLAAGVHDDDVAGPGEGDCLVQHEVVARGRLDREGGAGHGAGSGSGGVHRTEAGAGGGEAGHAVADVRDGEGAEAGGDVGADGAGAGHDPETSGHRVGSGVAGDTVTELRPRG